MSAQDFEELERLVQATGCTNQENSPKTPLLDKKELLTLSFADGSTIDAVLEAGSMCFNALSKPNPSLAPNALRNALKSASKSILDEAVAEVTKVVADALLKEEQRKIYSATEFKAFPEPLKKLLWKKIKKLQQRRPKYRDLYQRFNGMQKQSYSKARDELEAMVINYFYEETIKTEEL